MLDEIGAGPLTLLVVPDFHHRTRVADDAPFCAAMDARLARGDELVLHGMYHVDEEPSPKTLRGFVERRLLTRSEGEFSALPFDEAASRIADGVALFASRGWPLHGFVPPAWLAGNAARAALMACGHPFEYMTVRAGIHRLPGWQFERTANLCYSPDSVLRRLYSSLSISEELRRARRRPLLRISLHPQDARVPQVLRHWKTLVTDALVARRPVTKHAWVKAATTPPLEPAAKARQAAPRERVYGDGVAPAQ